MARRRGRPGSYLMTDDYSGITTYADRLSIDYWGSYSRHTLKRNLQEISQPLGDPFPVEVFRGSQYETTTACQFELAPLFVGKTTKPFPQNSGYLQFQNLNPGVGEATVGCTLVVY